MNAYDSQAIAKGIGTGIGGVIGGPIGASIGNAVGTFAGDLLFKPQTTITRNDSFSSSVDSNLGYRDDAFGKQYQIGYKMNTEKPTTFSNVLGTASDIAPTVMSAVGITKGIGTDKIKNIFKSKPSMSDINADPLINQIGAPLKTGLNMFNENKGIGQISKELSSPIINPTEVAQPLLSGTPFSDALNTNLQSALTKTNSAINIVSSIAEPIINKEQPITPITPKNNTELFPNKTIDTTVRNENVENIKFPQGSSSSIYDSPEIQSNPNFAINSKWGSESFLEKAKSMTGNKFIPSSKVPPEIAFKNQFGIGSLEQVQDNVLKDINYIPKSDIGLSSPIEKPIDNLKSINVNSLPEKSMLPNSLESKAISPLNIPEEKQVVIKKPTTTTQKPTTQVPNKPTYIPTGMSYPNVFTAQNLPNDILEARSTIKAKPRKGYNIYLSKTDGKAYKINMMNGDIEVNTDFLRGKGKGDYVNWQNPDDYLNPLQATTPAGKWSIKNIDTKLEKGYVKPQLAYANNYMRDGFGGYEYTGTQLMHNTYGNEPLRLAAYKGTPDDKCTTYGCPNVPTSSMNSFLKGIQATRDSIIVTREPNPADRKIGYGPGVEDSDVRKNLKPDVNKGFEAFKSYVSNPQFNSKLKQLGYSDKDISFIQNEMKSTKFKYNMDPSSSGSFQEYSKDILNVKKNAYLANKTVENYAKTTKTKNSVKAINESGNITISKNTVPTVMGNNVNFKSTAVHELGHKLDALTGQLDKIDFTPYISAPYRNEYSSQKNELAALVRQFRFAVNPNDPNKPLSEKDLPTIHKFIKTSNIKDKVKGIKDLKGFIKYSNILASNNQNKENTYA